MQIHGSSHVHGAQKISAPHYQQQAGPPTRPTGTSPGGDKLDISPVAQIAADQVETGGVRADRIAQIRREIAQGSYETPEKLDAALERLLDELG